MANQAERTARGKTVSCLAALLGLASVSAPAWAQRDLMADTWAATDALGRRLPMGGQVRAPRANRYVGIFYFVWQGYHGTGGPYDISKLLQASPDAPAWGPPGAFHWWGEPEIGYFRAADPWVARRNLQMLALAGVDTLFVDVTNAFTYPDEVKVLFETARQMRAEGNPTPQIAFVLNANTVPTVKRLWQEWYQPNRYPELWFRWQNKPLILADVDAKTKEGEPIPDDIKAFFTWRKSWFETDPKGWFGDGHDKWPWRDRTPQNFGWHDDPKTAEQIAVGIASHPTGLNIGRSYHNNTRMTVDRYDNSSTYDRGIQFEEQWKRVFEVDPQLVFVTGWNEWVAQRFRVAPNQRMNLAGRELKEGDTFFVDLYNAEFSRDADPMKGGYTDNYYYQLIANIRRYKGARLLAVAGPTQTIRMNGDFGQWQRVSPEYRAPVGDTMHRDFDGWGNLHYKNETGRNDIAAAKVSRDARNLFFYVRTAQNLTPHADPAWMLLFLDADQNAATGWNGCEYRINGKVGDKTTSVEHWESGAWKQIGTVPYQAMKNELHLSVPRTLVQQTGRVHFDFKWADNINPSGGIDAFWSGGDVAPPRRFVYRYEEQGTAVKTAR